jgi:hypothetical protein
MDNSSECEDYVNMENENRTVVHGEDLARWLQWTMVIHLPSPDPNPVFRSTCMENIIRIVIVAL